MTDIGGETFDGGDFFPGDAGDRRDARACGFAIDVHRTRAAKRHAAAKLRAGFVERVAEHPEQRHVRADVDGFGFAVQSETDGHGALPLAGGYPTTTRGMDENPRKADQAAHPSPARTGTPLAKTGPRLPGNQTPRHAGPCARSIA